MTLQTFQAFEGDEIPTKPGIYAFLHNPFNPLSLGIFKGKKNSAKEYQAIRRALKRKLKASHDLKSFITTNICATVKLPSGAQFLNLDAHGANESAICLAQLDALSDAELVSLIQFGCEYISVAPPLYCGITSRQTLRQRFFQHRNNFERGKVGTFGGRLSITDIHWNDLIFVCMPTFQIAESAQTIETLESLFISIYRPFLSNR